MKRKSIRFSIASMTGTLMLGAAALPASSLPGITGLLLIWLAVTKVANGAKRQTGRHGDITQASQAAQPVQDAPDSIDDMARQITHTMNVARLLPHNDVRLDALRSCLRSLAEQTNLLLLDSAIETATAKVQTRDTPISGSEHQGAPIRQDDTDLTRLAELQRRLINQFKV